MKSKTIKVDYSKEDVGKIAREGELNRTQIVFELDESLQNCDFINVEFNTNGEGENVPILEYLQPDEGSTTLTIKLNQDMTVRGTLYMQLVGYVIDSETSEPHMIAKSPVVSGTVTPSIKGIKKVSEGKATLLECILAKVYKLLEKSHTHKNPNTLASFYSDVDEEIAPNVEDWERPMFRGNYLRYTKDGTVITGTEEIEKADGRKFLRIKLYNGFTSPLLLDYIDIPISTVTDVTEESGDIILNGTEIDFGIQNEVSSLEIKHIIATQTALTLSPNTFYSFGEVEALDITLGETIQGRYCEYMFDFVSGASPTVLTLPADIIWVNELTVEANKRYEISIADNVALWCAVDVEVTAQ